MTTSLSGIQQLPRASNSSKQEWPDVKNNPEAIGRKMTVRTIKRRPIYANYDSGQDLKPFVMTVEQFMELE